MTDRAPYANSRTTRVVNSNHTPALSEGSVIRCTGPVLAQTPTSGGRADSECRRTRGLLRRPLHLDPLPVGQAREVLPDAHLLAREVLPRSVLTFLRRFPLL